ncbi:MAG: 50S ribosomal protein L10 [Desulfobacterales bacterium CG23_combo_of_CG06-09_8_20_14_all_51_8]|nr:MAG: 50S ribosomal protein L10 [Desulfobacterales bacterium CG23_combo_of_CG06-09_8_20_14_all_51_8]
MLNKNEKKQLVEEIHQKFLASKIVILTDYKGLNVDKINALRRKLKESNIEYRVVKNTLLIRASEDTDVAVIKDQFKGPTAIAMSYDDPVAPAKVLSEFAKDNDKLEIRAGVMSGRFLDARAIKSLSSLPSREVLLSQVLSAMNGVPTGLVRVLNNVPQKFLYALQAIKDQKAAA